MGGRGRGRGAVRVPGCGAEQAALAAFGWSCRTGAPFPQTLSCAFIDASQVHGQGRAMPTAQSDWRPCAQGVWSWAF